MPNKPVLRVLVVDESRSRAGEICAGLALAGYHVAAVIEDAMQLVAQVEKLKPDIVLIETENPSRDTLENLAVLNTSMPRPTVIFAHEGESETIRHAVKVGVSAYVVDGLDAKRIKPVIEVACARFEEFQALRQELAEASKKLSDRKLIDRAKGILMKARNLDEDGAYHTLRKLAMDRGQTIPKTAKDVIEMAKFLV